jgi:hypothetical protein
MKKEKKKKELTAREYPDPPLPIYTAPDRFSKVRAEKACSDVANDDYGDYVIGDPLHRGFVTSDEIIDPNMVSPEEIFLAAEKAHLGGHKTTASVPVATEPPTKLIFIGGKAERIPVDYVEETRISPTHIRRRLVPIAI